MISTFSPASADFNRSPILVGSHPDMESRSKTGGRPPRAAAIDEVRASRADRLVRPEIAAAYVESGDRLGCMLIAIGAALRAIFAGFRRKPAARRSRA
jgi:hypothetical protein